MTLQFQHFISQINPLELAYVYIVACRRPGGSRPVAAAIGKWGPKSSSHTAAEPQNRQNIG